MILALISVFNQSIIQVHNNTSNYIVPLYSNSIENAYKLYIHFMKQYNKEVYLTAFVFEIV